VFGAASWSGGLDSSTAPLSAPEFVESWNQRSFHESDPSLLGIMAQQASLNNIDKGAWTGSRRQYMHVAVLDRLNFDVWHFEYDLDALDTTYI
jgi:hypothetical protein